MQQRKKIESSHVAERLTRSLFMAEKPVQLLVERKM